MSKEYHIATADADEERPRDMRALRVLSCLEREDGHADNTRFWRLCEGKSVIIADGKRPNPCYAMTKAAALETVMEPLLEAGYIERNQRSRHEGCSYRLLDTGREELKRLREIYPENDYDLAQEKNQPRMAHIRGGKDDGLKTVRLAKAHSRNGQDKQEELTRDAKFYLYLMKEKGPFGQKLFLESRQGQVEQILRKAEEIQRQAKEKKMGENNPPSQGRGRG